MTEVKQEKDNFVLYVVLATAVVVGAILAVKMSENEKFAPINRLLKIACIPSVSTPFFEAPGGLEA